MNEDSSSAGGPREEIDTTASHSARVWDYWLGGQDNYAVDREVGDRIDAMAAAIRYWNEYGTPPGTHRTPAETARFFARLELVEPGVVSSTRWRPEPSRFGEPEAIDQFCAVGRKP